MPGCSEEVKSNPFHVSHQSLLQWDPPHVITIFKWFKRTVSWFAFAQLHALHCGLPKLAIFHQEASKMQLSGGGAGFRKRQFLCNSVFWPGLRDSAANRRPGMPLNTSLSLNTIKKGHWLDNRFALMGLIFKPHSNCPLGHLQIFWSDCALSCELVYSY